MEFRILPGRYSLVRLEPDADPSSFLNLTGFVSLTRTATEVSVLCQEAAIPPALEVSRGWLGIELVGPLDLSLKGVLLSFLDPLAKADVNILAISTYDTDTIFVPEALLETAIGALQGAKHRLVA